MSLLIWDKPAKARTTEEHNDTFVADGAPPGTYVPNMSREDQYKWKAKKVGGNDPRIEIRKTTEGRLIKKDTGFGYDSTHYEGRAQALLVVRWPAKGSATVTISSNAKAEFDMTELKQALDEACEVLL